MQVKREVFLPQWRSLNVEGWDGASEVTGVRLTREEWVWHWELESEERHSEASALSLSPGKHQFNNLHVTPDSSSDIYISAGDTARET